MAEGRTPQQVRTLISALTQAAAEAVDAPLDSIRVVVREVPLTHWGAGDVTIAERRGAPDPRTSGPGAPDPAGAAGSGQRAGRTAPAPPTAPPQKATP